MDRRMTGKVFTGVIFQGLKNENVLTDFNLAAV